MKKLCFTGILISFLATVQIFSDSSGIRKTFEIDERTVEAEFLGYLYKRFYLVGSGNNTLIRTESAYKRWDNLSSDFKWQIDGENNMGITSMVVFSALMYQNTQLLALDDNDNSLIYEMKWDIDSKNTTQKYIVLSDDEKVVWFTQLVWKIVPEGSVLAQDIQPTILEGAWEGEWYGDKMIILFVKNKSYWYGGWASDGDSAKFRYINNIFSLLDENGQVNEEWTILINRGGNYLEIYEDTDTNSKPSMASGDLGVFRRIE
jgi:hypothetical protein